MFCERLRVERSLLLWGIEEQSEVHYAMPVRVMEYDTAEYGRQVREKKKTAQRTERSARVRIFIWFFAKGPAAANHNAGALFPENGGMGREVCMNCWILQNGPIILER